MKADMINYVAAATGMTKKDSAKAVEATFAYVASELAQGNKVGVSGFGSFSVKHRAARDGRNPKTGEAIAIPECNAVAFKAGKDLKACVN